VTSAAQPATSEGQDPPDRRRLIFLLAGCSALGPVSSLLVMPALPAIRDSFSASTAATQAVVSVFLIAYAFGILFAGPASDRFGRRPVVMTGMFIFIAGCVIAALAPTLGMLVVGRVVQALGGAIGMTVARAIVGDLYDDWRLARALANLTLAMMLGTTISPYIGGVITEHLGWHANFIVMLIGSVVIAAMAWRMLPETRPASLATRNARQLLSSSAAVLRKPVFFACAVDAGVIYAVYLTFISVAPYVMSEMLGLPATDFGLYVLLLSGGYFLGNLYVSRRGNAQNMAQLSRIGSLVQALSAFAALAFVLLGFTHPLYWFLPMFPLAVAQGLSLPHITATAVRLAPGFAGVASSLIGFSQQAIAAASVQAMGFAPTSSPVPVLLFCAALSTASLLTMLVLRRAADA